MKRGLMQSQTEASVGPAVRCGGMAMSKLCRTIDASAVPQLLGL